MGDDQQQNLTNRSTERTPLSTRSGTKNEAADLDAVRWLYGDEAIKAIDDDLRDAVKKAARLLAVVFDVRFSTAQITIFAASFAKNDRSADDVLAATKKLLDDPDFREAVRYTRTVTPSDFESRMPTRTGLDAYPDLTAADDTPSTVPYRGDGK